MKRDHGLILIGIALLVFCAFVGTVSAATTWYVDDDGSVTELWSRTYDGGDNDGAAGVATDASGNVIVTGASVDVDGGSNYYTIKYDKDGNVVWSRTYDGGGYSNSATGVATDASDNVIVTGYSNGNYNTIKYDKDGNVVWSRSYDSGDFDEANGVATDASGNVIVTGEVDAGDESSPSWNYYTIKYDKDGNVVWSRTYDGGDSDRALGVATDASGNVIVTGWSDDGSTWNYYTIKYDKDGNVVWSRAYDGGYNDGASGVATDASGNVIVTGYSDDFERICDYYTIKYGEIDTTPPDTVITAGPSGTIDYNDVSFTWTGTDDITDTSNLVYQYKLDGFWSDWTSSTSKTYTDLPDGNYSFMVKAKDEAGIEDPTPAESSFTVLVNNPPDEPSNPSPSNHTTDQSIDVDLSWTGGDPDETDTVTYDVYLGTDSNPPKVEDDQSETTYDPPGSLDYGTEYYWQIVATDNHGASTSGPVWDFTTASSASTWYVDDDGGADFTTIQEAVNYASAGDTIIVRDGNYGGAGVNTSHLTIRSENGPANCIVDADGGFGFFVMPNESFWPFKIDYVNISGFTVTGGSEGIYFYGGCNNNTITNNVVSNNRIGIRIDWADGSGYHSITNNIVSNNSMSGIALWSGAYHNTVANNTVSGGVTDDTWGGGIDVRQSSYNIITNNTILASSGGEVILFHDSGGNLIYNNYFDNMTAFFGVSYGNIWNITKTPGENIIGGPYLGGNYWADYTGSDTDGDGLGDTPYEILGYENTDYLPLVEYVPNNPPDAPSNPSPSNHATDQSTDVDLSWTGGDPDAGDTVAYDVYFGTDSNPAKVSNDQSGTSYDPGSLSDGMKYYWKIVATDNHGASTSGPIWDFTTVGDTTPPTSITNLQNETGATWINWTWDNPPDADFKYVMVYVDGVWETNTSEEFYKATTLAQETFYELGTHTVDHVENINETWVNQTTKTTAAVSDTTPPETAITAGPSGTINYNEVTFEWSGTDDVSATSNLEYQYKLGDIWSDWTSDTSKTYTDLPNGDYTFMVRARDEAENEDPTPASRAFTVSVTIRRSSGGGGGGGTSLDSDGDGYFDTVEIMIGTDPNDPNDYPNKEAATPTPTPIQSTTTIVSTITALPQSNTHRTAT